MAFHARIFKTGELCIPGHAPEYVAIRFVNFQFNTVQDRFDAVYMVAWWCGMARTPANFWPVRSGAFGFRSGP